MNQLIHKSFNNNDITVINKDGNAWFVASEISEALAYAKTTNLTDILDSDESDTALIGVRSKNGVEQNREVLIINESGLYHALFKSRKKEAVVFRKWVTSEVLPSIRQTGSYKTPSSTHTLTADMQCLIKNLVDAKISNFSKEDKPKLYQQVWSRLKNKFRVAQYNQISEDQLGEAVTYIIAMELNNAPQLLLSQAKSTTVEAIIEGIEHDDKMLPKTLKIDGVTHGHTRVDFLLRQLAAQGFNVAPMMQEMAYIRNIISFSSSVLASLRALTMDCDLSRTTYQIH
ncbi:BRO-N domain-containing protein [Cysteiniphilum halobium]|uniref:BRO-N domain-containing protein n=1 Tax=Cysteiniphilum halobium TaxID=2219059 RepID=UPI003F848442